MLFSWKNVKYTIKNRDIENIVSIKIKRIGEWIKAYFIF